LKREDRLSHEPILPSIARPHGRARIETASRHPCGRGSHRIARPHGARIETSILPLPMGIIAGIARPHGRARANTEK
jgi:hypothetical protein